MEIKFNKKLYPESAIKLAIEAYAALAEFALVPDEKYFLVSLKNIDPEIESIIIDEFSNYVLSQVKYAD